MTGLNDCKLLITNQITRALIFAMQLHELACTCKMQRSQLFKYLKTKNLHRFYKLVACIELATARSHPVLYTPGGDCGILKLVGDKLPAKELGRP